MTKKAVVGVLGLGYVGLPLAIEFTKAGFSVMGIDNSASRVARLKKKVTYILDVSKKDLQYLWSTRRFNATCDFSAIKKVDIVIICVPTPLRKTQDPDISYIVNAIESIKKYLHKGMLIVLESTTYPGTTEELLLPFLSSEKYKEGKDFFLAFSPERIDPGNAHYATHNIPKVVGGVSQKSTNLARILYSQIVEKVIPVSDSKVAEMVKLLENTFRIVNIGMVNELAILCEKMNINVWEVIEAAKTKPFGFMPFYPGPGIGGHCIPADPLYLAWKVKAFGTRAQFIELASQINSYMPRFVVDKISNLLNTHKKSIKNAHILIVGVTYKKDVKDLRESPALEILDILRKQGARVQFYDPYIGYLDICHIKMKGTPLTAATLKKSDCVVIATDHSKVDYSLILKHAKLIFDTRGKTRLLRASAALQRKVVLL
jgi:UDP-N-acetyl-D-glucosamine dehydrogenase